MAVKKDNNYPKAFNNMFREYDIRGRVNDEELNPDNVYRIVKAYAKYLRKRNITKCVVGYDNRSCSEAFSEAAIKALTECGQDVIFIGLTITPATYFAQYHYGCEGAVMITASHNPDGWSGFKFAKGYSETLEPEDIIEVFNLLDTPDEKVSAGSVKNDNIRDIYVENIVSKIKMGPNKPKIVLDAGNGGAGVFVYEVFQKLGCLTFQLNCDPDMSYPHYFPNPSDMKVREKVRETVLNPYIKADLGLSFDGDGDRLGVIDNNGNNIWSDIVLAVLVKQLLEKKKGATVVYDVKCSQTLEEVIKNNGGIPCMWKTGHSYIKAKMHELKADLAGERSGHIFVGGDDYYSFDDAVFVGAKLVEYISNSDLTLSETIASFPKYVTSPEIKAYCPDELKYGVSERLVAEMKERFPGKVCDINGARVSFDDGWGLIRPSSNMPEMVLIFEGKTEKALKDIKAVFKEILSKYDEISSEWEND